MREASTDDTMTTYGVGDVKLHSSQQTTISLGDRQQHHLIVKFVHPVWRFVMSITPHPQARRATAYPLIHACLPHRMPYSLLRNNCPG